MDRTTGSRPSGPLSVTQSTPTPPPPRCDPSGPGSDFPDHREDSVVKGQQYTCREMSYVFRK